MPAARIRLTADQKRCLREHHSRNPGMTRSELSSWAAATFSLPRPLAKSTLADLLAQGPAQALAGDRKASHSSRFPVIECELIAWVRRCEELRLAIVTGATISYKARRVRDAQLPALSGQDAEKLAAAKFGKGWLYRFQRRHGLKSRGVHGEAGSTNADVVEAGREELRKVTVGYDKKNIYNMDETAFYYCAPSDKSVSSASMPGRKMSKKRITVALTTNADGSARPPLLFIGAAKQPRCFLGMSSSELGLQYESSGKGWMNTRIFKNWISRFNMEMAEEGRRVLLLLDNASSHRTKIKLSHVEIRMLPPNTTAHLQPQDAGVIKAFKAKIRELQQMRIVDRLDELLDRAGDSPIDDNDIEALHLTDVLEAMRWAELAWMEVSHNTIANCWRHTRILDEDVYELIEQMQRCRFSPPSVQ